MQNNLYKNDFDGKLFAERLREFAGAKKDCEIAKELGFSTSDISKIFNGKGGLTLDKLFHISNTYNCSIDYLLGITDNNTNQKEYKYPKILDVLYYLLKNHAVDINGSFSYSEEVEYEWKTEKGNVCTTIGLEPLPPEKQQHFQLKISDPIINYMLSQICDKRSKVEKGHISEDDFSIWLKGFFSDFDLNTLQHYNLSAPVTASQVEYSDNYEEFIQRITDTIGHYQHTEHEAFSRTAKSYCGGISATMKKLYSCSTEKERKKVEKEISEAIRKDIISEHEDYFFEAVSPDSIEALPKDSKPKKRKK